MDTKEPDIKAAIAADIEDRGENPASMEPLLVGSSSRHRTELTDLAVDLAARSAGLRCSLPSSVVTALADLVRAMNCYYSNLIEGHHTHPVDIERALRNDYSTNAEKRNLQLEAKAHVTVQQWIDGGGLAGRATTEEGLRETHRRFYELLPEELLWINDPDTGTSTRITPGRLRERDVRVGRERVLHNVASEGQARQKSAKKRSLHRVNEHSERIFNTAWPSAAVMQHPLHVPVSPGALPRFLARFAKAYAGLGRTDSILAAATAHHRLLWIHPFLDGNGRVARLMSHAMLLEALDTGGIWSVARGLARQEARYKQLLMAADLPRRNDLDGRGAPSEESLAEFAEFFLTTCIDQVAFMEQLLEPERLRDRILLWAEEEIRADTLPVRSGAILEAVLYRGQLPRADVPQLLGTSERQARRVTGALMDREVLVSESTRAPLRLAFPATLAARWMPGLFPQMP